MKEDITMAKRLTVFLLLLVFCCVSLCAAAEGAWTCPDCGQEGNAGNFCTNCGAPRPADSGEWTCPSCGQEGNAGNFCTNCGTARPGGSSAAPALQADACISVPGLDDLPLLDPVLYPGSPKDAYAAILQKHEAGMAAFEEHVIEYEDEDDLYELVCYPAGFADLTGDGTDELLILDLDPDSGDGDLYIYSADRDPARCIFSLPAIVRIYDDELQGIRMYTVEDGGRNTFVISYWDYGNLRVLQMVMDGETMQVINAWADTTTDFSGESDGTYRKNGENITWDQLISEEDQLYARRTQLVGSIPWETGGTGYGFDCTLQDAQSCLQ